MDMNIDTSKAVFVTNKFEQLQKKLNSEFYQFDDTYMLINELKTVINELLTILSDMC